MTSGKILAIEERHLSKTMIWLCCNIYYTPPPCAPPSHGTRSGLCVLKPCLATLHMGRTDVITLLILRKAINNIIVCIYLRPSLLIMQSCWGSCLCKCVMQAASLVPRLPLSFFLIFCARKYYTRKIKGEGEPENEASKLQPHVSVLMMGAMVAIIWVHTCALFWGNEITFPQNSTIIICIHIKIILSSSYVTHNFACMGTLTL